MNSKRCASRIRCRIADFWCGRGVAVSDTSRGTNPGSAVIPAGWVLAVVAGDGKSMRR